ncbi:branched-chain amino acid transport system II carrier protein [Bacterioplanes sanyensis]|uniref:Branched-chain amino acid transport system carrier protein n=1 Tax=Bacterioplanes sanyensis TaxID=1249553 RepID=A0A222FN03_9GAMM|nr:branched-chain amino acid transport system II carrier protein [Bacterioplanes sanyensis]ASP40052.1 branched-chain amino acid transport system II carrier protein [Bacterioplanes sanyensis]
MSAFRRSDVMALGFMTFALFLGAGNLIIPPDVGRQAGSDFWPATLGFLATGVGLPLLGVVAAAMCGGGLRELTRPLPRWAAVAFGLAIYLSIGPLFAIPRTATVAFEMGTAPWLNNTSESATALMAYTVVFFVVSAFLALSPGKLMDRIGKYITPALIFVLAIMAGGILLYPQGSAGNSSIATDQGAFAFGFMQGYQTMDALASVVFGIVIIQAIRDRGIKDRASIARYTLAAGVIAAVCLSLVYVPLSWLGATSHAVAAQYDNGGQLIALYITEIFGPAGQLILAMVITLACLTTAVGLLTSCGEYFNQLMPSISYRVFVIVLAVFSALVANQGLSQIIQLSIPVLVALYPLTMTLIALSLMRPWMRDPQQVFAWGMGITTLIAIYDGLAVADLVPAAIQQGYQMLPLASSGMAWLVPAIVAISVGWALQKREPEAIAGLR